MGFETGTIARSYRTTGSVAGPVSEGQVRASYPAPLQWIDNHVLPPELRRSALTMTGAIGRMNLNDPDRL